MRTHDRKPTTAFTGRSGRRYVVYRAAVFTLRTGHGRRHVSKFTKTMQAVSNTLIRVAEYIDRGTSKIIKCLERIVYMSSMLEDSGERHEYNTGALREPTKGKGRYDLVSPILIEILSRARVDDGGVFDQIHAVSMIMDIIVDMYFWLNDESTGLGAIKAAVVTLSKIMAFEEKSNLTMIVGLRRLAAHYENGAEKYEYRNWEKGIPVSRCFDSAVRHMIRYIEGGRTEDHLAAAVWNIVAILHYYAYEMYGDDILDLKMPWRGGITYEINTHCSSEE